MINIAIGYQAHPFRLFERMLKQQTECTTQGTTTFQGQARILEKNVL